MRKFQVMHFENSPKIDQIKLRQWLVTLFTREELRTLCFDLDIDYENLPVTDISKDATARELIVYSIKHKRINDLLTFCQNFRPKIPWDEIQTPQNFTQIIPGTVPYKGLSYFKESDSDLFFGREKLIEKLVDHLQRNNLLALIGNSGIGKSSLVQAGLLPVLEGRQLLNEVSQLPSESKDWLYHVMTPTNNPLENLATSLANETEDAIALHDSFREDSRSLRFRFNILLRQYECKRFLLIIDQFEELFTLCNDEEMRQAFISNLMAATDNDGEISIVIILRADFYSKCDRYDLFRQALNKYQEFIGPLNKEELRDAIEKPAFRGGWEFQDGLVDWILNESAKEPSYLPLLSQSLLKTWENRRGNTLTFDGYIRSGGLRGAITHSAEEVFEKFSDSQQSIAQNIFLRLIEISDSNEATRRRILKTELILSKDKQSSIEVVLDILAKERLIATSAQTVELIHEALIREWPRLRSWLEEYRVELLIHRRLSQGAAEWWNHERHKDYLYTGLRLKESEIWEQSTNIELNQLEREFLKASKSADRIQRQRRVAAAITLSAIIVSLSLLFGLNQNRAADRESRIAATSQANESLANNALTRVSEQIVTTEAEKNRAESAESLTQAQLLNLQGQSIFEEYPLLGLFLSLESIADAREENNEALIANNRMQIEQGRLASFSNVENIYVSPDETWFLIDYYGRPGEIRDTFDNSIKATLPFEVDKVFFSPNNSFFIIDYSQPESFTTATPIPTPTPSPTPTPTPTPSGGLTIVDGTTVTSVEEEFLSSVFAVVEDEILLDRLDEPPAEVRQVDSVNNYFNIPGLIKNVHFNPIGETMIIERISLDNQFLQIANGNLFSAILSGQIDNIFFSPTNNNLVIDYQTIDDVLIQEKSRNYPAQYTLNGEVEAAYFDLTGNVLALDYYNSFGEIRQLNVVGGIERLEHRIDNVYLSPNGEFVVIDFTDSFGILKEFTNGNLLIQFDAEIAQFEFTQEGTSFYVTYNQAPTINRYQIQDNQVIELQSVDTTYDMGGAEHIIHNMDNESFIVDRNSIYVNGEFVTVNGNEQELPGPISFVKSSPNNQIAIIDYYTQRGQVVSLNEGRVINDLISEIEEEKGGDFSENSRWFILHYKNGRSELWSTQLGNAILDLGISPVSYHFLSNKELLLVLYGNGQVNVIDLAFLELIEGQAQAADFLELEEKVCSYLFNHPWFDKTLLVPYVGRQEISVCSITNRDSTSDSNPSSNEIIPSEIINQMHDVEEADTSSAFPLLFNLEDSELANTRWLIEYQSTSSQYEVELFFRPNGELEFGSGGMTRNYWRATQTSVVFELKGGFSVWSGFIVDENTISSFAIFERDGWEWHATRIDSE